MCPAEALAESRLSTHLDFQVHSGRRSRQSRATTSGPASRAMMMLLLDLLLLDFSESAFGEHWQSQRSRRLDTNPSIVSERSQSAGTRSISR
jgi:hypothetical protein